MATHIEQPTTVEGLRHIDAVAARLNHDNQIEIREADQHYLAQVISTSGPLIVSDILAAFLSAVVAGSSLLLLPASPVNHFLTFAQALLGSLLFVNFIVGLYPGIGLHPATEMRSTVLAASMVCLGFLVGALTVGDVRSPYIRLSLVAWLTLVVVAFPLRILARSFLGRCGWWGQPAVILGRADNVDHLNAAINVKDFPGVRVLGAFSERSDYWSTNSTTNWLGDLYDINAFTRENDVFWGFIETSILDGQPLERFAERYGLNFRHFVIIDPARTVPGLWNRSVDLQGLSGVHVPERLLLPSHRIGKRVFDLTLACTAALLLSPLFGLLACLVYVTSPGPVFFGHRRIGQGGRHFKSWKFRTMATNGNAILKAHLRANPEQQAEWERDQKLKDDPRVTALGRFLRTTSLDELPQLWNVIRGEMSMVGPRPIVDDEISRYAEVFPLYKRVKPGITGLWQISGRNNTTYPQRVNFDRYYIRNWSPWLDLYILGSTIKTVILREGAY